MRAKLYWYHLDQIGTVGTSENIVHEVHLWRFPRGHTCTCIFESWTIWPSYTMYLSNPSSILLFYIYSSRLWPFDLAWYWDIFSIWYLGFPKGLSIYFDEPRRFGNFISAKIFNKLGNLFLSFLRRCVPCKKIAPAFEQFSTQYSSAIFMKVDVDICKVS